MTEKEKRIAIIATVIVIIILLLFFVTGKARRASTVVPVYDDPALSWDLGDFAMDLGDLIIPDLTIFRGVSKCGCGPKADPVVIREKVIEQVNAPQAAPVYQPANYQSPKPSIWGWGQSAPLPPKNYGHNNSFWGG